MPSYELRTTRCTWRRRPGGTASFASTARPSTSTPRAPPMINTPRLMSAIERYTPADPETARLEERIAELQRERDQLVAVVDILPDHSVSPTLVRVPHATASQL